MTLLPIYGLLEVYSWMNAQNNSARCDFMQVLSKLSKRYPFKLDFNRENRKKSADDRSKVLMTPQLFGNSFQDQRPNHFNFSPVVQS